MNEESTHPKKQKAGVNALKLLNETVIEGGYCVGCGTCAAIENSPLTIRMNSHGMYGAFMDADAPDEKVPNVLAVCPFSQTAVSEDEIAEGLYPELSHHARIGRYRTCYAGYVRENAFRDLGSSGGLAKWLLCELLRRQEIDAVVQVAARDDTSGASPLYRFEVHGTAEEVKNGSRSAYYPVEMSGVLNFIRENPGRYAITGVPCFTKGLRLLSKHEPVFKDRIRYCIGIVCGHLKSAQYAEMLAWQLGVHPENLKHIEFRAKFPGKKANEKGVIATGGVSDAVVTGRATVQELFGANYGHGLFKYKACDFCDDVVAETADISIGDAWLPEYVNDGKGTSIVVTRNRKLEKILQEGIFIGSLHLDEIAADDVARSQDAGLRHRREGLAYRLFLADSESKWRPPKRVLASERSLTPKSRQIQRIRMLLSGQSHGLFAEAKRRDDFDWFRRRLHRNMRKHDRLSRRHWKQSLYQRVLNRLSRVARALSSPFGQ